jgi:predicted naringenin-chalcone synthase
MLIDIAVAVPPFKVLQAVATEKLKSRMADRPAIARMIDSAAGHSGIESRYVVVPDAEGAGEDRFYGSTPVSAQPGTGARMKQYESWSKTLGLEAARRVLEENAFPAGKIDRLITISCTGFFAPGLDCVLAKELNLPSTVRRTHIGFMGCAASLVGFGNIFETRGISGDNAATLLVSVELCSLHLQTAPTRDNILANTVFADGAAAALFSPVTTENPTPRLDLIGSASLLFEDSSALMGWKIGDTGFEMILSSDLPKVIQEKAVPALIRILAGFGFRKEEINHWALHPGGRAILDALQDGLGLGTKHMEASRIVLRDYGNMSSASILFVLKEVIRSNSLRRNEICCAVGFGPGLSMEVALLKVA